MEWQVKVLAFFPSTHWDRHLFGHWMSRVSLKHRREDLPPSTSAAHTLWNINYGVRKAQREPEAPTAFPQVIIARDGLQCSACPSPMGPTFNQNGLCRSSRTRSRHAAPSTTLQRSKSPAAIQSTRGHVVLWDWDKDRQGWQLHGGAGDACSQSCG